jgi:parallel beta-helix repeat protein
LTPIAISWHGVNFHDTADDSSRLEYCLITGSDSSGIWCENSSPTFSHCTISGNSADFFDDFGGGVCLFYSNAVIENCDIIGNSVDDGYGGGIYVGDYSNPIIKNCTVTGNTTDMSGIGAGIACGEYSSPVIENCTITYNSVHVNGRGGGIYGDWSTATIRNCTIKWNSAGPFGYGGGIYLIGCNATISYCTISGNVAGNSQYPGRGGGICYINSSPLIDSCIIENCTIIDNSVGTTTGYGGGIWCAGSGYGPNIVNSIVASNDNGGGICFNGPSTSVYIIYSDFYGNGGGDLIGPNVPEHLGQIVAVNNNGDPCDIFYNIFLNPMLTGNYHLQAGSPCIDAGDPNSPYDPDSTIADIGAFFFDQSSVNDPRDIATPKEFRLYPNYPNPFNASTVLYYSLPQPGVVALSIHNVLGQRVVTLVEGRQTTGVHTITWDASNMASGVYFARLVNNSQSETIKMLLLK